MLKCPSHGPGARTYSPHLAPKSRTLLFTFQFRCHRPLPRPKLQTLLLPAPLYIRLHHIQDCGSVEGHGSRAGCCRPLVERNFRRHLHAPAPQSSQGGPASSSSRGDLLKSVRLVLDEGLLAVLVEASKYYEKLNLLKLRH